MSVTASGGSSLARPQLYQTVAVSTILQAEQQDRFPERGELNELCLLYTSLDYRQRKMVKLLKQNIA